MKRRVVVRTVGVLTGLLLATEVATLSTTALGAGYLVLAGLPLQARRPGLRRPLLRRSREFEERLEAILQGSGGEQAFIDLAELYANATPGQRRQIRVRWNFDREWVVPHPRGLALTVDGTITPQRRLRAALIYLSITDLSQHWTDYLASLCLIYHSAVLLGTDPYVLFLEVAGMSTPETAEALRDFLARYPEDKEVARFGFRPVVTAEGIWYARDR